MFKSERGETGRPEEGSVLHKPSANRELTQLSAVSRDGGETVMTRLSSLNNNDPV